jgi:amino acid transporter
MKNWFFKYEQVILFYSVVIYMVTFTFVFDEQLRKTEWMSLIWVAQFFGFATLIGLRGIKKGWKWPKRY